MFTVRWTQIGGESVRLNNASAISPTFNAPDGTTELAFRLVVTDVHGLSGADTTTVSVQKDEFVYLPLVVRHAP